MPGYPARIVWAEYDSRHLIANKIGHELLQAFISVKVNLIVNGRIIMENFSRNIILRTAAHNDFIYPHGSMIVITTFVVERRLAFEGLIKAFSP